MNVSLTPQLEDMVRKKVESGLYNSSSEVVREALRLLEEEDMIREWRLEKLRTEIRKGIESGSAGPLDMGEIITRGRERLAQQQREEAASGWRPKNATCGDGLGRDMGLHSEGQSQQRHSTTSYD